MASRATRISMIDHERLQRLARRLGVRQQEVLTRALDRFERELLLDEISAGFASLREQGDAWLEEMRERQAWDAASYDDPDAQ